MLLAVTFAVLALPLPLSAAVDRTTSLRNRRLLMFHQPHQRRNGPFVVRMPYSKTAPANSLFSHAATWRAKQLPSQAKSVDDEDARPNDAIDEGTAQQQRQQTQPTVHGEPPQVSQFHSQDIGGRVMFGFSSPDQMRMETRNADGTVHGTYSYLDPYGQVIRRQYWDNGAGFHVTSNTFPVNGAVSSSQPTQPDVQYTADVQAARDLHFQLYQQALESLLPVHHEQQNLSAKNETLDNEKTTINQITLNEIFSLNDTKPVANDGIQEATTISGTEHEGDGENAEELGTQNGSIVIENPEYLRISWTSENKKYRLNLYNATASHNNTTNKVQIRHQLPDTYNISKFIVHGRNSK